MLADDVTFTPCHQLQHVTFADMVQEGLTSIPHTFQGKAVLPSRPVSQTHPEEMGLYAPAQEFQNMQEPKIRKLKGGYTSSAGLIFQSWLKEINVHVEDRQLTEREAIQLVKDLTNKHAWDKVEF